MTTFEDLLARLSQRTPQLSPVSAADSARSLTIAKAELFPGRRGEAVEACRAGLLLLNDDLDAAHSITQDIHTPTGSFWHAVVHRREGDFSNARYWWHRTGPHPAFPEIYEAVLATAPDSAIGNEMRAAGRWNPTLFNDRCQSARQSGQTADLEAIQKIEMLTLLRWCATRV